MALSTWGHRPPQAPPQLGVLLALQYPLVGQPMDPLVLLEDQRDRGQVF